MSLIELSNPYLTSFASGLFYGLVFCTPTCLPYIAGYVAGTGANFRKGVVATLAFSSGRIVAYTLIGVLVSIFSGLLYFFAEQSNFELFQVYSAIVFSIVTILLGVLLLYRNNKNPCNCNQAPCNKKSRFMRNFDVGAFTLGLSRGFVVCPYLLVVLFNTITYTNPFGSVVFAALFGIGTAISPMLLIGGVTGWLLNKATLLQKYIALAGAIIIILLGVITLVNSLLTLA